MSPPIPKVLLGLTGSSSLLPLLPELRRVRGSLVGEYICVMTRAAANMVSPSLVSSSLASPVHLDSKDSVDSAPVHRTIASAVDAALIAPATLNTMASLALGTTSNLLTLTLANVRGPVAIVPSVNEEMAMKPAARRITRQLQEDGYLFGVEESSGAADLGGVPQSGLSPFGLRRLLIALDGAIGAGQ